MSQRLHIGPTGSSVYDCVITSVDGAQEKLKQEWLMLNNGYFVGPWKIKITDRALYRKIEPIIESLFGILGRKYPDCIWYFYDGTSDAACLEHPTRQELSKWIESQETRYDRRRH